MVDYDVSEFEQPDACGSNEERASCPTMIRGFVWGLIWVTEVWMIDEGKVAMRMKMQSFCSWVNFKTEKNEQSSHALN